MASFEVSPHCLVVKCALFGICSCTEKIHEHCTWRSVMSKVLVWLASLLCLVIGSLVYLNTLHCGIVYDDEPAIMKNKDLRPEGNWIDLLYNDFWGTHITNPTSHKSYRPLCVATFRLNYLLHELEPMGYHLVNILLHGVVCYLYVQLCSLVFSEVWPALIAGLLFAVHPIHTEAVAGLVGRTELLAGIFYISAFLVYQRAIKQGTHWLLPVVLLVVCSVLSKEQGVTIVAVCVVHDLFIHHHMTFTSSVQLLHSLVYNRRKLPSWFPGFVKRTSILATITVVMLVLRVVLVGGPPNIFSKHINPALFQDWPWRPLSWLHLVFVNCWLALDPSALTADWRFGAVPLTHSLSDHHNILTLLTLVSLTILATFALSGRGSGAKVTFLGLSLMVFPYLPASNLFFPVGFVVAERVLYLPSMGLCLLVAHGAWKLHSKNSFLMKTFVKLSIIVLLLSFAAKTWTRNSDWESNTTLYGAGVRVNPNHGVFLTNLGIQHGRMKNFTFAEKLYRRSMEVAPLHSKGFSNFGGLMEALKRYDEAEQAFRKAIELGPQDDTATKVIETLDFLLKKVILRNDDRFSDALEIVDQVLRVYPTQARLYKTKGVLLQRLGQSEAAIQYLDIAVQSKLNTVDTFYHLGLAYLDTEKAKLAAQSLRKAVAIDHSYKDAAAKLEMITRQK